MDKFEDRDCKRIAIAKRSVFGLSSLYLKLSVPPSVLSNIRAIVFMSLFIHFLVPFRSLAVLVTAVKNGLMENGDWSTVLIYKL